MRTEGVFAMVLAVDSNSLGLISEQSLRHLTIIPYISVDSLIIGPSDHCQAHTIGAAQNKGVEGANATDELATFKCVSMSAHVRSKAVEQDVDLIGHGFVFLEDSGSKCSLRGILCSYPSLTLPKPTSRVGKSARGSAVDPRPTWGLNWRDVSHTR